MAASRRIHWKAPSLAVGSLLTGVLLALGHHLFYASLDGSEVPTTRDFSIGIWSGISSQRFNIAVGTLFAFLVKTCLCFAVGVAQVQVLWRNLKSRTTRLSTVDSMTSLTEDIFGFLDVAVWRHPLLVVLALIIWLTPIAAIITPSTLSVGISPKVTTAMRNVSNVDFTSLSFASIPNYNGLSSAYSYQGPQFAVSKVAIGTAAQGQILPIAAPASVINATYEQVFSGPALKCSEVSGAARDNIDDSIARVSQDGICSTSYGYLAWVPDAEGFTPFVKSANSTFRPRAGTLGPTPPSSSGPQEALSIYVASLPGMTNKIRTSCIDSKEDILRDATIVQCQLQNVTYLASFSFQDGTQKVNISHRATHGGVIPADDSRLAGVAPLGAYAPNGTLITTDPENPWSYNVSAVRTYAYQSVMDAFGQLLSGSIASVGSVNGALVITNTSIMTTVLGTAKELAFLRTFQSGDADSGKVSLQAAALQSNLTWDGTWVKDESIAGLSLREGLETLFQNITVSLMSSALLQANTSSPYAPQPLNVTSTTYRNVYDYSAQTLWITYGIAILLSTAAVAIGLAAIVANGVSYTGSFSTTLRTTSHAVLSHKMTADDAVGQDPMPKHLGRATITFLKSDQLDMVEQVKAIRPRRREDEEGKGSSADSRLLGPP